VENMENLDGFFALIVIMLNALDKKWEIDATIIQKKLAGLSIQPQLFRQSDFIPAVSFCGSHDRRL